MNIGNMAKGVNDVERLDFHAYEEGLPSVDASPNGEYVRFADYEALQSKLNESRELQHGWFLQCEYLQQELAATKEQLSGMDELMKFSESEEMAVWDYLQKHSPWSPSNDMNWSDEIICGIDGLQQQLAAAREALQAAEALTGGRGTAMDSLVAAFNTWPDDIKKKLSLHDLRRMSGWAPRSEVGNWRIDTSAGGPILVYQNCSVIEGEQARYLINLIKSDNALAALMENTSPWECPYKLRCECLGACKHGHGIDATLQRDRRP